MTPLQQNTEKKHAQSNANQPLLLPSPPELAPPSVPWKRNDFKFWLMLLLILGIGCLGSLSLVPSFPKEAAPKSGQTPNTPTPVSLSGGECIAEPEQITYLPSTRKTPSPLTTWTKTGFTSKGFTEAQACAASFVVLYETVNASNSATFTASASLLTRAAIDRFYGLTKGMAPDLHTNQFWQSTLQKQQRKQSAQTQPPELLSIRIVDNRLLVWLRVPYTLTMSLYGEEVKQEGIYTVLVVSIPPQVHHNGTGWQVSAWQNNDTLFAAPNPL